MRTTGAFEPSDAAGAGDAVPTGQVPSSDHRAQFRKPLMATRQLLLMNFGFFGIQYSFGLQQNAITPIFTYLHAKPEELPLLNMAGPITGLLIQPLIGAMSDRTWSPGWGRRKPFFVIGALGCSVCLLLFPFVTALWMAVLLLWLLDAGNNTAMEPKRAFIADKLPLPQLGQGFLTQSLFTGLGVTMAGVSLFVFQWLIRGETETGIPYWVVGSFLLGAVFSISSVLVAIRSTPEDPPTAQELAELRARKAGVGTDLVEIARAIKDMPGTLWRLALVYLFQWYALFIYWQFCSLSIAKTSFHTTSDNLTTYAEAVGWTGLVNGFYNVVAAGSALVLVITAKRYSARWVHAGCLALAAAGLLAFPHLENKYLLFIPMVGLGIAWASAMGIPYVLAVPAIPKSRYGVYMGIINMMIVIPMLIQTCTFGIVYDTFLHSDPGRAITFAAILLFIAAVATLRLRGPGEQEPGQDSGSLDPTAATA
jgi:maltose/moltooligosaccharide transporter